MVNLALSLQMKKKRMPLITKEVFLQDLDLHKEKKKYKNVVTRQTDVWFVIRCYYIIFFLSDE